MEKSIAISVRNICKKFRLFNSARERLWEALHPFKKIYHREFWALREISFDVFKGETVGIIGRNGSGKSTLLQIICSVLKATSGTLEAYGKISALLELGAGFNPEFTGRDNVMMYGSLMGFSPEETVERIPLIEGFADIGEFFEQPIKTYSSGMFVRLAFAAAINVDPDILVVDEALSVGDAKFQHKCFVKFREFQEAGKTILFVSHDTNAVLKHCDYAILLENGRMHRYGAPKEVVNHYIDLIFTKDKAQPENKAPAEGDKDARAQETSGPEKKDPLQEFLAEIPEQDQCFLRRSYNKNEYRHGDNRAEIIDYLLVAHGEYDPVTVCSGETVDIYIKARFHHHVNGTLFGMSVNTVDGIVLFGTNTLMTRTHLQPAKKNDVLLFKYTLKLNVSPGDLFLDLGVGEIVKNEAIPIERRCSIVHLNVREKTRFAGLVDLEPAAQPVFHHSPAARDLSGTAQTGF